MAVALRPWAVTGSRQREPGTTGRGKEVPHGEPQCPGYTSSFARRCHAASGALICVLVLLIATHGFRSCARQ
jgi:hypothetical protein